MQGDATGRSDSLTPGAPGHATGRFEACDRSHCILINAQSLPLGGGYARSQERHAIGRNGGIQPVALTRPVASYAAETRVLKVFVKFDDFCVLSSLQCDR